MRTRQIVPLRTTDGPEQDRIGFLGQSLRRLRLGNTRGIDRAAAQERFRHFAPEIECLQNAHRFGHDFRADTCLLYTSRCV